MGQFADKPNRIAEEKGGLLVYHLSGSSIQCCEELIFGKNIGLAQHIHKGAFAHIGIPYQCHTDISAALFALGHSLLVYFLQPLAQEGDFVLYYTAVSFNFSFTGATATYTPTLPFPGVSTCP